MSPLSLRLMAMFALAVSSSISKRTRTAVAGALFLPWRCAECAFFVVGGPRRPAFETLGTNTGAPAENRNPILARYTLPWFIQHPLFGTAWYFLLPSLPCNRFRTVWCASLPTATIWMCLTNRIARGIWCCPPFLDIARSVRRYLDRDRFEAAFCLAA